MISPRSRLVASLGATLCVLFCQYAVAAPSASTSGFLGDASNSGMYSDAGAARIARVAFAFQADGPIRGAPAIVDGFAFFGTSGGTFYAIDARTGQERWRFRAGASITSSPAYDHGRVFFSNRGGWLYALDARSGAVKWKHRFGADLGRDHYWDDFLSSPKIDAGVLYVGGGDGVLHALRPGTGRELWRFDAHARIRTTPAIAAGHVVFGTDAGNAVAVDAHTGKALWSFSTEGASHSFAEKDNDTTSIVASPTISGSRVLVGGRDGLFYALDLNDGKALWKGTHDGSSWILSSAADRNAFYLGSGSAQVVQALDPATGKERWRYATTSAVFGALSLSGTTLLASDFAGHLTAIDTATGRAQWQFPLGGRSMATPVAHDGVVYCGSDSGVLVALSVVSGQPALAAARRIAYRGPEPTAETFTWFKNGVDQALFATLKGDGYEPMDDNGLATFMRAQQRDSAPSVVVFTDDRVPATVLAQSDGVTLLRHYLDAGGKVVFPGPDPLAYQPDPKTGTVDTIDYGLASRVFDMVFPTQQQVAGYYTNAPTEAGRAAGLRSPAIGFFALDNLTQPGLTVLSLDEFGHASAWLRSYGGRPGSGLLQLTLPRQHTVDLSEYRAAIEQGVTW